MDVWGGCERHGSVGGKEEGTSSRRRTTFEEYEDDGVNRRAMGKEAVGKDRVYNLLSRSQSLTNACIRAMHVLSCPNLPYNHIREQWHPGF